MSKDINISSASIGSNESGTEGLFGGCVFAAFRITKSTFKKFQEFDWFEEILTIKDSKKFSEERCQELCEKITNEFEEGKDFWIWNMRPDIYNKYIKVLDHNKIKFIGHDRTHQSIERDASFHVAERFFKNPSIGYRNFFKKRNLTAIIDEFFKKDEFKLISISIASILARGTHLKEFYAFTKELGIDITDKENHNLPPTKIEPILKKLESQGMSREFIFENYCKLNIVKKYKKNLFRMNKQKSLS